jgi:hypothetical protein
MRKERNRVSFSGELRDNIENIENVMLEKVYCDNWNV